LPLSQAHLYVRTRREPIFHVFQSAGRPLDLTAPTGRVWSPSPEEPCGRDRPSGSRAGAEGATAPEPLRQKDRRSMALWKAAGPAWRWAAHRRG